jgi:cyclase
MNMSRKSTLVGLIVLFLAASTGLFAERQPRPLGTRVVETESHRLREVAPGIFFASGRATTITQSNSLVIVSDSDVIVVDSHVTPLAAKRLFDSIKQVTTKPVRYLVNTHFHFDHAYGNESFPPDVAIISHDFTREKLLDHPLEETIYVQFLDLAKRAVQQTESALQQNPDPERRKRLETILPAQQAHYESMAATHVVPPDITVSGSMTIHRPGRTIELLYLGRGHTAGDLLVLLPEERMLFTGDFLLAGPSYMGDAYIYEWIQTLEKVKALDFDWILPGHGDPFSDRSMIDASQRLLQAVWDQFSKSCQQGLTPEEAVKKIDLSKELAVFKGSIPEHTKNIAPMVAAHVYEQFRKMQSGR